MELAARGVSIDEIRTAVQQGNSNLPTGTLDGRNQTFTVKSSGQLLSAKAFGPLIVTYRDGAPVRLEEIARVVEGLHFRGHGGRDRDGVRARQARRKIQQRRNTKKCRSS